MQSILKLSKAERKMLELLQADANLSVESLAQQVNLSKSACWRRLQNLIDTGVITHKVTLLNQKLLNLDLTVYISVRTKQYTEQWAEMFETLVLDIPELLEVHRMTGDRDYLLKAVVTDMSGYDLLFKQLSKADLIDISSSFVMETMKQTTRLPLTYVADN
ncbi:MAG: Lrp/AsnC family transcriptional regulator [Pseudomonadales bacterium]|nr:Lrp/AsnC family transcriptional regulator [Pseudomonadales bacterium]NRA15865.1 Lrp/AsnC family transcriptional regulator [Oceanospirillaceae bacterium]